jgi:hypothetical protein
MSLRHDTTVWLLSFGGAGVTTLAIWIWIFARNRNGLH